MSALLGAVVNGGSNPSLNSHLRVRSSLPDSLDSADTRERRGLALTEQQRPPLSPERRALLCGKRGASPLNPESGGKGERGRVALIFQTASGATLGTFV